MRSNFASGVTLIYYSSDHHGSLTFTTSKLNTRYPGQVIEKACIPMQSSLTMNLVLMPHKIGPVSTETLLGIDTDRSRYQTSILLRARDSISMHWIQASQACAWHSNSVAESRANHCYSLIPRSDQSDGKARANARTRVCPTLPLIIANGGIGYDKTQEL